MPSALGKWMCGHRRPRTTRNIPLRTASRWLASAIRGFFNAGTANPVSRPSRNRTSPSANRVVCMSEEYERPAAYASYSTRVNFYVAESFPGNRSQRDPRLLGGGGRTVRREGCPRYLFRDRMSVVDNGF